MYHDFHYVKCKGIKELYYNKFCIMNTRSTSDKGTHFAMECMIMEKGKLKGVYLLDPMAQFCSEEFASRGIMDGIRELNIPLDENFKIHCIGTAMQSNTKDCVLYTWLFGHIVKRGIDPLLFDKKNRKMHAKDFAGVSYNLINLFTTFLSMELVIDQEGICMHIFVQNV